MNQSTYLTRTDAGLGVGLYDSIAWALEVHCKQPDTGIYNAAVLTGSEDAPDTIEFYTQPEPLITDTPAYTWRSPDE